VILMPILKKQLAEALYMEETDLINSFIKALRFINSIYMGPEVKPKLMSLLNKLLFDTIRHSNIISGELMRVS
jgi:hypothetical protein